MESRKLSYSAPPNGDLVFYILAIFLSKDSSINTKETQDL